MHLVLPSHSDKFDGVVSLASVRVDEVARNENTGAAKARVTVDGDL